MSRQKNTPSKRNKVIEAVKNGIQSGELPAGKRIATVRELSANCNVSLSVVQKALQELMNEGLVECRGSDGFYVVGRQPSEHPPKSDRPAPTTGCVYLSFTHHSDLVWRHTYEEYDKIRDEQLLTLFSYARQHPEMCFSFEQAEIARIFLDEHPELLEEARKLVREGLLDLYGAFCIPDLNMVSGESLFRNFELGQAIYQKLFGRSTPFARMSDAFGMCAQLPQICALCGMDYLVAARTPNAPDSLDVSKPFRWNGLDGETHVDVFSQLACITHLGYDYNVPLITSGESRLRQDVATAKELPGDVWLVYMTEETVLRPAIFPILAEANQAGGKPIQMASATDYVKTFRKLPEFTGEFNPTLTGCYTTRIGVKQGIRLAETRMFQAEFLDALRGDWRDYTPEWRDLLLAEFHDAACGCHVDSANAQIMNKLSCAADVFHAQPGTTVVNFNNTQAPQLVEANFAPAGIPCQAIEDGRIAFVAELPPCGVRTFQNSPQPPSPARDCPPVFDTAFFHVDFSTPDPVIVNRQGENVFAASGFGEILIRFDCGSMWSSKLFSDWRGRKYQRETILSCRCGKVFYEVITEGDILPGAPENGNVSNHWPGFGSLRFRKQYRFFRELDYFTLRLTLDWEGHDTRIAIRFPTAVNPHRATATYETPCASIVRKPYFEVPEDFGDTLKPLSHKADYTSAHGDWPALNWVDLCDYEKGLAVANTGTPGHQLTAGAILISLLRSGSLTQDGQFAPPPGSYDNGRHIYNFAFRPHSYPGLTQAYDLGVRLNRQPATVMETLPEGSALQWDSTAVALSALRPMSDGTILLRFYETIGQKARINLTGHLLRGKSLWRATPFGKPLSPLPDTCLDFHPFEIKNLILQPQL